MERLDRANQIYHLELIKSKSQQEVADARSAAGCLIVITDPRRQCTAPIPSFSPPCVPPGRFTPHAAAAP